MFIILPIGTRANCGNTRQTVDHKTELPVWKGGAKLKCVAVRNETADVKTFVWQPVSPARFAYDPGQFITLRLNINGNRINRTYTLSSSPLRPFFASITVKRQPGGIVSNYLHDEMRVGWEIEALGPGGRFSFLQKGLAEKYLFLSGGSGITPLLSMSRYFFDSGSSFDTVFIHNARTPADIICRRELKTMAEVQPNFKLRFFCDKQDERNNWHGYVGFLTAGSLAYAVPDFMERTIFCCGPPPYMKNVRSILQSAEFNMESYYEESFTFETVKREGMAETVKKEGMAETVKREGMAETMKREGMAETVKREGMAETMKREGMAETDKREGEPTKERKMSTNADVQVFSIFFQSLNKLIQCDVNTTVLTAAHENNIDWPSMCEEGICGTCIATKLSGELEMEDQGGITEVQLEEGGVLLCCSKPRSDLVFK